MKLKLKKLSLKNFKGIKQLEANFGDRAEVSGANGTGKTTIADAWWWLLTGKNYSDQTDSGRGSFQVMTADKDGNIIRDLEHSVEAVIEKDGEEITLGRSIAEVWEVINGESEPTKKGNTTKYYINGVEIKKSKFQEELDLDNNLLRLCAIPGAFTNQEWKTQREMLLAYSGDVTLESMTQDDEDRAVIETILKVGFDNWKKDISNKKKAVKAEIAIIPGKIDTAQSLKPAARNWEAIEKRIEEVNEKIALGGSEIKNKVKDLTKSKERIQAEHTAEVSRIQNETWKLRNEQTRLETEIKNAAEKNALRLEDLKDSKRKLENSTAQIKAWLEDLRAKFRAEEARTFYVEDAENFRCPVFKEAQCSNPIILANAKEAKEKALQAFYEKKEATLSDYNKTGREYNATIAKNTKELAEIDEQIKNFKTAEPPADIAARIEEIKARTMQLNASIPAEPDLSEIDAQIKALLSDKEAEAENTAALQAELKSLTLELGERDTIDKCEKEIKKFEERQAELRKQLGELENAEFHGDGLKKRQMAEVERRVNSNFENIEFKLFEKQINGGEADTCQLYVGGVPYGRGLNKAAEINAQLEIINYLQRNSGIAAPVFVDNAESVNELQKIDAQLIALRVTTNPLQIETL